MTDSLTDRDYRDTLFLPATEFPMRGGLPKREPDWIKRWDDLKLYEKLRADAKERGAKPWIRHDGPPYANGHIHLGTAMNKIVKDIIVRSHQMTGHDAAYLPGWDCHGLPIEWKVEEEFRSKNRGKDDVPGDEFRAACRAFAQKWVDVQAKEFRALGIEGEWDNPYLTMKFESEASIVGEFLRMAMGGTLVRGAKPIMWSPVERTALAEAEVEYHDRKVPVIWVKFPVLQGPDDLMGNFVVIWTTTPWTIPGNRAIAYSPRIAYGLYEVTAAENDFGPQPGEKLVFADALAEESFAKSKLEYKRLRDVKADELASLVCAHPLKGFGGGYDFNVPLLAGDHVTDDAGTGFVHTAPGHGREDFDAWMDNA
ncbi:class I tRNA ligase family protein, partial [uncultured Hyphomonas sp.]|uniref:class I tRNA ligase family protein n=1 Tax=uncultured Hyphomonas sp. TaxID=225298 RepID=UPI003452B7F2